MNRVRWMLVWCIGMCIGGFASDATDRALMLWQQWRSEQVDQYQAVVDQAQRGYAGDKAKADSKAISALIAVAKREARKPDKAIAIAAWKAVLRIDDAQADAVAFFTAIGQLDQVRGALDDERQGVQPDLLTATETAPAPVQSELKKRDDAIATIREAFAKVEARARDRYREDEGKARTKLIKELAALASKSDRAGDIAATSDAWKAVLLLDRSSQAAREYFTGLGTFDVVLAALPAVSDPLGDPPDPDLGYAPVSLRGLKVLILSQTENRMGVADRAIHDHCVAQGMQVTLGRISDLRDEGAATLLQDQQLIMLMGLGDATRGSCIGLIRTQRTPVVILDVKTCVMAGLMAESSYNGHTSDYTHSILIKAPGNPLAAGLSGKIRVLDPLPATGPTKPVPVEQDPDLLKIYGPVLAPSGSAVAVAGLEPEHSSSMLAFDTGHLVTIGTSKEGTVVTAKLPARRLGFWMFSSINPDQVPRLSRDFWRLWDGALIWSLRGAITPQPAIAPPAP